MEWDKIISEAYFDFQPIIDIFSGKTYGFEALLRGLDSVDFPTVHTFFDRVFKENLLGFIDQRLLEKAVGQFIELGFGNSCHLFYNLDNRIMDMGSSYTDSIHQILTKYSLPSDFLYFEVSERHEIKHDGSTQALMSCFREKNFKIALDDFGSGYSGLMLLYHAEPDIIKIDRFFISNIDRDSRKKLFLNNMIQMAHIIGIKVVAEGIETSREYFACKEIGCDLMQGYLIQRPAHEKQDLLLKYGSVEQLSGQDKRNVTSDQILIMNNIIKIEPVHLDTDIWLVLDHFKKNKSITIIPVLNHYEEPIGIIREESLKDFVYSPYGKDVLKNKKIGQYIQLFLSSSPIADIHSGTQKILELFHMKEDSEGIIIIESGQYRGFLTAKALLYILNEKALTLARELNPLTKLPGNIMITENIAEALGNEGQMKLLVYFDFDSFKPFNDQYGFRQGDRIILLFAELLEEIFGRSRNFIGHIGGDDFFVSIDVNGNNLHNHLELIALAIDRFSRDVLAFYNQADREQGFIVSRDRNNHVRKFQFLSVSAGCVFLLKNNQDVSMDELSNISAKAKKAAKTSPVKMSLLVLENNCVQTYAVIHNDPASLQSVSLLPEIENMENRKTSEKV
jgi:EAL domain-containing protein (putative c-di-GMP-specific phosphodiesterase class I)/GGDEF domain-containing protein